MLLSEHVALFYSAEIMNYLVIEPMTEKPTFYAIICSFTFNWALIKYLVLNLNFLKCLYLSMMRISSTT